MPYQPGVQDISGQLRAQGQAGLITGIGQGIAEGIQAYSQNKFLARQSIAKFEAAARANPDILKFLDTPNAPPDASSALTKLHKGGAVGVKDAAVLEQFANSYVSQKAEAQKQQAAQMQLQAAQQQLDQQAKLRQIGQFLSNPSGAPYSQQAAAQMQAQLQANPFLQTSAQLQQAGMSPEDAAKLMAAGAKIGNMQKPDKAAVTEQALPSGQKVAFSPSTGAFSVLPQSPEQLGKAEAAKAEAETNAKSASSFLTDITDSAENARHTIGTVDRVLSLYDQGVESGFAQPTLTQARAALARFGLGKEGVGNQQQFEKELNNLVLERGRELMKGSGAVSNYEREAIAKATANPSLTPEANKQILAVMKNIAQRSVKLDELRSKLEDEGKSNVEISKALRKARDQMPVGLENLAIDVAPKPAAAATTAPAAVKLPPGWSIKN
jgi:hypothetical protein